MKIHPLASISPQAELGRDIEIGPFCVVEAGATIGDRTRLANHVIVKSDTTLGSDNQVFDGAVLGGLPQHLQVPEQVGSLTIGDGNTIREHVTVHRSLSEGETTQVGSNNLLMVGVHIAHDCLVGNQVVLTNHTLLGGHVTVEDRANFGGAAAVHQFCRIGRLAMIGGHARVHKDVPPFVTLDGATGMVVGLNRVGLRRAGMSREEMDLLKTVYRTVYRSGLAWDEVLEALDRENRNGAGEFRRFLDGSTRGFVQERRTPPSATIRLHLENDNPPNLQSMAG